MNHSFTGRPHSLNAVPSPDQRHRVFHPGFGAIINVSEYGQPQGNHAQTAQTVAMMARLAAADSQTQEVQQALAAAIVEGAADPADPIQVAAAIFWWVRRTITFQTDPRTAAAFDSHPETAEVLIRPSDLLRMPDPREDCDGFSMLAAALLLAADIPCSFKTVAAEPGSPDEFSHVYVIAHPAGHMPLPMDCSHGPEPGWEITQDKRMKSQLWPILPPPGNSGLGAWGGIDLNSVITQSFDFLKQRYGTSPGGYIQTNPDGSRVQVQQAPGSITPFPATIGLDQGSGTLLLVGGLAIVLLFMATKDK